MTDYIGRSIDGKIRMHVADLPGLRVFLHARGQGDDLPCKCCASECAEELTISVTFCGMTVTETIPIPGMIMFPGGQANLPDGSFLIVSAVIDCTDCHWVVGVGICAFCEATQQFASETFEGLVPFADTPVSGVTYCPETGAVNLECFGDQFGIPCVTNPTASIA